MKKRLSINQYSSRYGFVWHFSQSPQSHSSVQDFHDSD